MKRKKRISLVLLVMLVIWSFPMKVFAEGDVTPARDGPVKMGYYDDSGQWQEGSLNQNLPSGLVSVDKTASQDEADANKYNVTLKVKTKQTTDTILPGSAAAVLVLDTSGSMAEDGRLDAAKSAAADFIDKFAGNTAGTGRYLAVVNFSTRVKTACDWVDVSTAAGKSQAKTAISRLDANGGTNLHAGLLKAKNLFSASKVSGISTDMRNVVVLTDGVPTYYLTDFQYSWFNTSPDITIDGVGYDIKGDGGIGSKATNDAAAEEAAKLRNVAEVYTVCYGAAKDVTYTGGPTVGDFLRDSIASATANAYNADKASELAKAFAAISQTITEGIDGKGLTVFDGEAPFVSVSGLPNGVVKGDDGFTWVLNDPVVTSDGSATYFEYTLNYVVTLDANNPDFVEDTWYPLNGETYLDFPCGDGVQRVDFPIPAAKGVKDRFTVTWEDFDGTLLERDEGVVYGSDPSYDGEEPARAADAEFTYEFKGWTPEISPVTGDVTYTAEYKATKNLYTVTWVDEDGTELEKDEGVPYGEMPSYDGEKPSKSATAEFTYEFAGWTPEVVKVTGDAVYKATYKATTNLYTVTWVDEDGTVLEKDEEVPYGAMPSYDGEEPFKAADAEFTYAFDSWTPEIVKVTGDATYTATYKATTNLYTVTWVDEDGKVLEKDEGVPYGEMPSYDGEKPSKDATAEFSYEFAGWTPEVVKVTGNAVYKATYEATTNLYTVTWVDEDGTVLEKDEEVPYGAMPSYDGEEPVKAADAEFTYRFAGWTPKIVEVTGDAVYEATYVATTNLYTVTWVDGDGTVLEKDEGVPYGAMPSYDGEEPVKAADAEFTYKFDGWTPEVAKVTGDAVYKATYSETRNLYTVTWVDEDGTVLEKDEGVPYGEMPKYDGEKPSKDATAEFTYAFDGWTPEVVKVTGDAVYKATYKAATNLYTVTWVNEDGTVLEKDEKVPYGEMPSYDGKTPEKAATAEFTYRFVDWSPEVVKVTGDAVYKATYVATTNVYTVTWVDEDGTVLEKDESVPYGAMPSYDSKTPEKAATAEFTYKFDGWTPEVAKVTGDAVYKATYSETRNLYTVTWVDEDGTVLEKDEGVPYGEMPKYDGEKPSKAATAEFTYEFDDWTPEVVKVTGDAVYKATYKAATNLYTVTWVNEDGTVLEKDEKVPYGEMPSYDSERPSKAATAEFTYEFAGWTPEVTKVTGDAVYKATYIATRNVYTVTWIDEDGKVLEEDRQVPYGEMPSYDGDKPVKESTPEYSYEFSGWTPEVVKVTGNAIYKATYKATKNLYTVIWIDEDGKVLEKDENVPYGEMPSYDGDKPVKAADENFTYEFKEWTPEIVNVIGNAVYKATYTATKIEKPEPEPEPEPIVGEPEDTPKTGDANELGLWLGLLLASGSVVGGTLISRRKRRSERTDK